MDIVSLDIPDVKLIIPKKFSDSRGFFSETYNYEAFSEAGINCHFVQDSHSFSSKIGVLRGLHYQKPPMAQDKLIRVLKGRILDIVVDIRPTSPTFGKSISIELSAENWTQIFVPKGFAHGFVTTQPDTEVAYKLSNFYAPDQEDGIIWNDPDLDIDWQTSSDKVTLSDKDKALQSFADFIENNPF